MSPSRKLVHSFGVFYFDLNHGQSCEFSFPDGAVSEGDLKAISMLCFPDSQSATNTGNFDSVYTFSYRILKTNYEAPSRSSEGDFLQCFVYFRQVEDPSNARGYYQKSFVLTSNWSRDFSSADDMLRLVRGVGNKFYLAERKGCGKDVLIDAYDHIQEYGYVRRRSGSAHDLGKGLSPLSERSLGPGLSPRGNKMIDEIHSLLRGLWHLWEALLVGLPILVHYPGSADLCSKTVLALPALINPIVYRGDIRPFLSIFDPDYELFRSLSEQEPYLVGVTSPLAYQQLSSGFSVLIVFNGSCCEESNNIPEKFVLVSQTPQAKMYLSESVTSICSGTRSRMSSLGLRFSASFLPSLLTQYRLCVPPDAELLSSKLVTGLRDLSATDLNRAVIQRHFASLTRDFLMPYLEYVETDGSQMLRPESLFQSTPAVKEFVAEGFLQSVSVGIGRHLSVISKEKLVTFYRRFIET
jgi:hypothetical protein